MKRFPALALAVFVSFVRGDSASAATFNLTPTQDAFVMAANPTSNYGGAGALGISGSAATANGEFNSLLQFDFASAKNSFDASFGAGQWAIDSITLQLSATSPNNPLFNGNGAGPGGTNINSAGQFSVRWMQNDSWTEGTGTPSAPGATGITFATLPGFLSLSDEALGTYAFAGGTSGNTIVSLSLAAPLFVADAQAGNPVSLLLPPATSTVSMLANSRSTGTMANRPLLTVSAIPEPGALVMAFTGILASLFVRRRNHACAA